MIREVFCDSFVEEAFPNTPQQSENKLSAILLFFAEIDAYALTRVTSQFTTENYC